MTETSLLPAAPEAPEAKSRRNVLLAGGLAAVVLAGGGYYFLAGGSSSDNASDTFVVPHHKVAPRVKTAKAPTKAKAAIVPATSTVPIGRNPFKVLYVAPVASSTGTTTQTSTTGSTGSSTSTTTGSTTGSTTPTQSYALTLVSVTGGTGGYAHQFTFSLAGTKKTVLIGQKFGNYGELQVLTFTRTSSGKVTGALVQVGDDDPVPVAIGQKITVQ